MKNKVVSYKVSLMNNATKMQGVLDEQKRSGLEINFYPTKFKWRLLFVF